ncbi:MAG: hypothetical protein A2788_02670 [Candidatus Abawacabacteria bacterium RIFCSPHIGHO2_01_FULL_46_8]|uniref:Uncharacterized protein n=1 Tax=Candidatus Abawacabacteria bacterium RIFCSPHIGHO2_01_FULL_46_8 TaxID=1817815 RepID=A0A1F4XLY0_9BACT|nr:MAG: hypothetical protein A2788_02670 [Candidatus Abawacabacteria bacterium RIFCSPHIGHO2_01_FULL_46_8]
MAAEKELKNIFQDRSGVLGVDTDQTRYQQVEEIEDPADNEVVNFCKDCQKLVVLKRRRRRNYCSVCDGYAIFIGTKRGLKHHFRLKRLESADQQKRETEEQTKK